MGVCGSVVGWGTMLQAGRLRIESKWCGFLLILPTALWPWGHSVSNRIECEKSSWEVKGSRHVGLIILPPSVSWLSRQSVRALTSHNPMALHGLLQGLFTLHIFIYVSLNCTDKHQFLLRKLNSALVLWQSPDTKPSPPPPNTQSLCFSLYRRH
jgi:hypothetical protein